MLRDESRQNLSKLWWDLGRTTLKLPQPLRLLRERQLPIPAGYVAFFPTGRCNFRCPSCKMPLLEERHHELRLEEIKSFFGRSKVLRGLPITIAGGEPFVRKDIIEILDFLTSQGRAVFVTSNGWYLDRISRLAEISRTDLLTIAISIDGLEEAHDQIRGKGSFARACKALAIARAAGCGVRVNTVIQPDNVEALPEISGFFREMGVDQAFLPLWSFPGMSAETHLTPAHYPQEKLASIAQWANGRPTDAKYVLSRGEFLIQDCHAGSSSVYISPEGDVYACVTMKENADDPVYKMGSLRAADLDFDAIWGSERAWEVRRNVRSCSGCYSGCEASRELLHGFDGTLDQEILANRFEVPVQLRLDDPTSGPYLSGDWYHIEDGFRWMGQSARVRLTRPESSQRVAIRARAVNPDLSKRPLAVRVLVDNYAVGKLVIEGSQFGEYQEASFALLPTPLTKLAEVELQVERVWVPSLSSASVDTRRLGVMVEKIGFISEPPVAAS